MLSTARVLSLCVERWISHQCIERTGVDIVLLSVCVRHHLCKPANTPTSVGLNMIAHLFSPCLLVLNLPRILPLWKVPLLHEGTRIISSPSLHLFSLIFHEYEIIAPGMSLLDSTFLLKLRSIKMFCFLLLITIIPLFVSTLHQFGGG